MIMFDPFFVKNVRKTDVSFNSKHLIQIASGITLAVTANKNFISDEAYFQHNAAGEPFPQFLIASLIYRIKIHDRFFPEHLRVFMKFQRVFRL